MKSLSNTDEVLVCLVIGFISKIIRLPDQAQENKHKGDHLDISSIQMKQMITLSLKNLWKKILKQIRKVSRGFMPH